MWADAPDLCAASDGDGDRNLIIGRGLFVTPSDSLALLAANAHLAPGYAKGLAGIARSMPTEPRRRPGRRKNSGIKAYETPTGWKFFGNLLDAGLATICGEESAGTGSNHVREKDGLWAVLLWLNILAAPASSASTPSCRTIGAPTAATTTPGTTTRRSTRDGANAPDGRPARQARRRCRARRFGGLTVATADDFAYHDPVDGSDSAHQGIRILFADGARIVYRLSGTGTAGATLRVYIERYEPAPDRLDLPVAEVLAPVAAAAGAIAEIEPRTGRSEPSVVT